MMGLSASQTYEKESSFIWARELDLKSISIWYGEGDMFVKWTAPNFQYSLLRILTLLTSSKTGMLKKDSQVAWKSSEKKHILPPQSEIIELL